MLNRYCIAFEGIDRSGKNVVSKYVNILGKYKYVLMDRGLLSNITYARMNGRDYEYDISQFKTWVIVYLVCAREDWEVRCKIDNEPPIDYETNMRELSKTAADLQKAGIEVLVYDTSAQAPYAIAKDILMKIERLDKEHGQDKQVLSVS